VRRGLSRADLASFDVGYEKILARMGLPESRRSMDNWPTWVSASATGPWNNCSTGAWSGPPVARKASKV